MDALVLAAETGGSANTAEVVLFVLFGAIALGAGVAMIVMRNIVHSALMLVINFLSIAALYLGLQSSFLSIVQVIVRAGLAKSGKEAKRLITENGARLDDQPLTDAGLMLDAAALSAPVKLSAGKKRHALVKLG